MKYIKCDGGRSNYFKGKTGDCVTRAICNATGLDYKKVYDDLNVLEKQTSVGKNERRGSSRTGIRNKVSKKYIENVLGWKWVPTMKIGSGCKVHLVDGELPNGTLIVRLSHHLTCVKDGVLYDMFNCSLDNRCVYGYFIKPGEI